MSCNCLFLLATIMLATIVIVAKNAKTTPERIKTCIKFAFCFSSGIEVTSCPLRTRGVCLGTLTFNVSTYFSANATSNPFFLNYPLIFSMTLNFALCEREFSVISSKLGKIGFLFTN